MRIIITKRNIKYLIMGNYLWCQQHCNNYICRPKTKKTMLKMIYKQNLKAGQFRDVSISLIDLHYEDSFELEQEEILRKSIAQFSHYECNSLNHSIIEEYDLNYKTTTQSQLPYAISSMTPELRQRYLLNLIKQSYLFVDLTDCMENQHIYEKYIKHQLMDGDSSLDQSFIKDGTTVEKLEDSLRHFNEEIVCQLQSYVKFCRKVKYDFTLDNDRFLGKLNLNLQSEIIRKYLKKQFRKNAQALSQMIEDIDQIIKIIIITIESMYDFSIKDTQIDHYDFYNEMNLYTMVTSITFQNEEFVKFMVNKMKECFAHRFRQFRMEQDYTAAQLISDFIGLNSRSSRRSSINTDIHNLVKKEPVTYSGIDIFPKSKKILQKIYRKPMPLFKLKMIYELNKEMSQQIQSLKKILYEKYNIDINCIFNRQTELLIIKWLLKSNKYEIDNICSHLLYTYFFIHRVYKIDRKGSCLTTFIQEIERIVQYQCV